MTMTQKQFSSAEQDVLEQILFHRRDIRGNNFLKDPLPEAAIDKILHAATLAPSVGFSQPWEFVIIRDEKTKADIFESFETENSNAALKFTDEKQELYKQLKLEGILETPVNIAVFYKPSTEPVLGQTSMLEMGEYSVVCAVQNMWLMSRALK